MSSVRNISMAKKINAGDLRHRITFQQEEKIEDGYKGYAVTWKDKISTWALIEPLTGREYFYAHQITNEVSHRIIIRYRQDVTASMRIKYKNRIFNIESMIDLEERHMFLEFLCREIK